MLEEIKKYHFYLGSIQRNIKCRKMEKNQIMHTSQNRKMRRVKNLRTIEIKIQDIRYKNRHINDFKVYKMTK